MPRTFEYTKGDGTILEGLTREQVMKMKVNPTFKIERLQVIETPYTEPKASTPPPQAPTPPPQARPQVAQTPPPQETPQEGAFFEDAETQEIYNSMNSRTPEQIRDMAMDVETGVAPPAPPAPQLAPRAYYNVAQSGLNTSKDYSGIDMQGVTADFQQQAAREYYSGLNYDLAPKAPAQEVNLDVAYAEADSSMSNAVKRFADDYMGGTNVDKIINPKIKFGEKGYTDRVESLRVKLADKIKKETDPDKRRMIIEQRKKVMQLVQMMNSTLDESGEIIVSEEDFKGKQAVSSAIAAGKQDLLASRGTGTTLQAIFPAGFDAAMDDESLFNIWVSNISDITRLPGNFISSWISAGNDMDALLRQMGVNPTDKRARDQVIGELGNALNYMMPNAKAFTKIGKGLDKLVPTKAKKLINSKILGSTPGEQSLIDLEIKKGADMISDKFSGLSIGAKATDDARVYSPGVKGYLKDSAVDVAGWGKDKAINIVNSVKGAKKPILDAVFRTAYQQSPETFMRSLETLTDKDESTAKLLMQLVAQTAVGSVMNIKGKNTNVSESSRVEKLLETSGVDNAQLMQGQLKEAGFGGFATNRMQSDEIEKLVTVIENIYKKDLFKELNDLTGNVRVNLTKMVSELRAQAKQSLGDSYKTEFKEVSKRIDELEALGSKGETTADFVIGQETKKVSGREITQDITIKGDPTDLSSLGKAKEGVDIDAQLAKTDFEDLKNINANMNKLKKDLENIRASDFQTTSKQIVGGGSQYTGVDKVAKLQEELNSVKQLLDGIDETAFKKQSSQVIGGARSLPGVDEVNKIKSQLEATQKKLDNIDESNFQGSSQQIIGGKKDFVGVDNVNKIQEELTETKKLLDGLDESNFKTRSKQMIGGKKEYVGPEKVARLKGELASAKKELKEVSPSDFNKTTKQIVGGGRELPVAERVKALKVQLKELRPEDLKTSKNSYISADGTTQKYVLDFKAAQSDLKEEIKLLEAGQFNEANIKFGKSVTKKRTEVDAKSLNQRKDELSNKIKELEGSIESAKKSQFDETNVKYGSQTSRDITKTDGAKFNEFKKELSDRVAKLESELGSAKKSQFDESNVKFGASTSRGITKTDGAKFNEYKNGLSEEIDKLKSDLSEAEKIQFEGAKYGQSTIRTNTVTDDVKFNELKKELSDKVKELESNLELASKGQFDDIKYGARKTRIVTDIDTDAMAKAKANLNDEIDAERLAAGDAGRIGGEVIIDKAKNIQKLDEQSEMLTPNIVPGSTKTTVSYNVLHEKLASISNAIFDSSTSAVKDTNLANALKENIYKPLRNSITKDAPLEDQIRIDELLDKAHTLELEILGPLRDRFGRIDGALEKLETSVNKFVRGGKAKGVTLQVLGEMSESYKILRKAQYNESIKGLPMLSRKRDKLKKDYESDIDKMSLFANAEMKELSIMLEGILKKQSESPGKRISNVFDVASKIPGLKGVLLRSTIKAARQGVAIGSKRPEESIEAISEAINGLTGADDDSDASVGEVQSIGESTTERGFFEKKYDSANQFIEGVKGNVKGVAKVGGEIYDIAKPYIPTDPKKKSEKLDAYKSSEEYKTLNKEQKKTTDDYFDYARSIGQTVKSDVVFKSPKPIINQLMLGMNATYKELGITSQPAITSAEDADWLRPGYDRHEKGTALDYRLMHLDEVTRKKLVDSVKEKYKNNPNIDVEDHGEGQNYHLHIELDAK